MAAAEAGNACHLLIFLDQRVGLPVDILDRNLNRDLALGGAGFGRNFGRSFRGCAFFSIRGAHSCLSSAVAAAESGGNCSAATPFAANLSVKTMEEQRQTAERVFLLTKVMGNLLQCGQCCRRELAADATRADLSVGAAERATANGKSNGKRQAQEPRTRAPHHTSKYN
jgi:hypothetical protein